MESYVQEAIDALEGAHFELELRRAKESPKTDLCLQVTKAVCEVDKVLKKLDKLQRRVAKLDDLFENR